MLIAAASLALYFMLGNRVSDAPPAGIDITGRALAGKLPSLAYIFTASCYVQVVLAMAVAVAVLAIRSRAWRGRALFAVIVPLAGWPISDFLKNSFMRARPDYWVRIHETSYSYSSGHAMFSVLIYGLWAYYFATSDLPRGVRTGIATFLGLWALGVLWSRLALGAHFVTDLIGGVLLATTLLSFAVLATRIPFSRSRAAP